MFHEVNSEFDLLIEELENVTRVMDEAREVYLLKEASYENLVAQCIQEGKLLNPKATQTDLNARAETKGFNMKIELVHAECNFKRLTNRLKFLRDRLDALKEKSYNLRKEATL